MNVNYEPISTVITDFAEHLHKAELIQPILQNKIPDETIAKDIYIFIEEMVQLCAELSNKNEKLNGKELDYHSVEKAYILIESNIAEAGFEYVIE